MEEKYFGSWGWAEFDTYREEIISQYNISVAKDSSKPVKSAHGIKLEESIISWLEIFLPGKYGVTSGYIAPNNFGITNNIYHYDVIIYLKDESPTLWIETDRNCVKTRAIPAEYVVSVFEVKSTFTHRNIRDGLKKLSELNAIKSYLHPFFFSCVIFCDLLEKDTSKIKMIYDLYEYKKISGFWGGLVLKNNIENKISCFFSFEHCDKDQDIVVDSLVKKIADLKVTREAHGKNIKIYSQGAGVEITRISKKVFLPIVHYGVVYAKDGMQLTYTWGRDQFTDFAFGLLNRLMGHDTNNIVNAKYCRIFQDLDIESET